MDKSGLHFEFYDFSSPWIKDKIPLLLIHGLGANLEMWYPQIPFFSRYFPVIVIDLPGSGESKDISPEYSIELFADLINVEMKKFGINKLNIMGISLGGLVALEYTYKYPGEVDKMILLSVPHSFPDELKPRLWEAQEIYKKMDVRTIAEERIHKAFGKIASIELKQYLIDMISKTPHEVYIKHSETAIKYDSKNKYKNIQNISLIVCGELDYIATPAEGEKICKELKFSELFIIKDTGHALSLESPDILNEKVFEFLMH